MPPCFERRPISLVSYQPQQPQYQQYNRDHDQCMDRIPCPSDSAAAEKTEQPQDEQDNQNSFEHFDSFSFTGRFLQLYISADLVLARATFSRSLRGANLTT